MNIPIFALGWVYVGKRFFLYSLAGMLIFTAAVKWVHVPIPVEDKILYIIITFRELAELKRIVHRYDPNAFMVVSDTLEVMGLRIGNQPHW